MQKQSGFVALFAVLISAILLAMALSISSIAYKEQLLSVNAKSSQFSFTAADSGMECALYWDINQNAFVDDDGVEQASAPPINCNDMEVPQLPTTSVFAYQLPVTATVNATVVHGCAVIYVNKSYDFDGDTTPESTKIDSRGYNTDCSNINVDTQGAITFLNGAGARSVERFLTAQYLNNVPVGSGT